MELIDQSWQWMQKPERALELIEQAGRTCYKSEDKITDESAERFVKMIIKRGHHSVLEHVSASVKFITNRGVTHELVRHRVGIVFSQESTRYVNYGGDDMEFIKPVWWDDGWREQDPRTDICGSHYAFMVSLVESEHRYNELLRYGWRPEQAREVLPNALKTEIVMTANLREWIHVFNLRCSKAAHPQIRSLMRDCLSGFQEAIPVIFDDITY